MRQQGKTNKELRREIELLTERYSDQSDAVLVRDLLDRIDGERGASSFAWAALYLLEAIIADPDEINVRERLLRILVSDDLERGGDFEARAAFNVLNAHGPH